MSNGKKLRSVVAIAAAAFMCGSAQAGFVLIDDWAPIASPSTSISVLNDFGTQLAGEGVDSMYLGRTLGVAGYQGGDEIDVDLFGAEAAFNNQFWGAGSLMIDNEGGLSFYQREIGSFAANAGALDFGFCAVSISACLSNAQNDTTQYGSLQSIGMWLSADGNTAWLLWDDSGAQSDDNHDDLVVRLTYRSVPEPGTLALLGLGLVGIALIRRRKGLKI